MSARLRKTLCVLFLATLPLAAQKAASVVGVARNPQSGEAVAGARITLRPNSGGRDQALVAASSEEGRFEIPNLRPGDYELVCEKTGFVRHQQWVTVTAGTVKVDAKMVVGGRISGRVSFGEGKAAAGIPVEVRRRGGRPRYTAYTTADGSYQFDTLPPGSYLLCAGGRGGVMRRNEAYQMPSETETDAVRMGWAPTFFPGVGSATEAQSVSIGPGAELSGYDVRLLAVPVNAIRGTAVDERGDPVGSARVELYSADSWFGPEAEATTTPDGSFELNSVRAGEWSLRASAQREKLTLRGHAMVLVAKSDADRVRIDLSPPFEVEGFVERDEPRDASKMRKVSGIALEGLDGGARVGPIFHDQEGRFRLRGVYPGRYRVLPLGFVPGWYVDSVLAGEQEAMKSGVELRPNGPPLRITYKPNAGRVRGVLDRAVGTQVVLLPVEEEFWDAQFIRTARVGNGGQFDVGSLRPGEYYVFAFAQPVDSDVLSDPPSVRPILQSGVRVPVKAGEISEVKLRVTSPPGL